VNLNYFETHDRLKSFKTRNSEDIGECCQNIIDQRPFGEHPFYIFAHKRTIDIDQRFNMFVCSTYKRLEDVPTHTIIWQPRLTKPKSQTNSMLFKAYPKTDLVKVIWIIPERELFGQYEKGNMTESDVVSNSIYLFENDRAKLEEKEPDDLSDEAIDRIYKSLSVTAKPTKLIL